jgi:hypothetical protein
MEHAASQSTTATGLVQQLAEAYLLCVDGAGVFLLCLGDEVTFGGFRRRWEPGGCLFDGRSFPKACHDRPVARRLFAFGSRPVTVNQRQLPIDEPTPLEQTADLALGESVEIRFSQPNVLSLTAVLDFPGAIRPQVGQPPATIDRVVLMDQNCLIGPGDGNHIRLDDCADGVILYRNKGRLWCKSKAEFRSNDQTTTTTCVLESGDVIAGNDYRFRIEAPRRTSVRF